MSGTDSVSVMTEAIQAENPMTDRVPIFNKATMIAFTGQLDTKQVTTSLEVGRESLLAYYNGERQRVRELMASADAAAVAKLTTELKEYDHIFLELAGCLFEVNVVYQKNGQPYGHAYIWTNSPVFYNICAGLNPDGSQRLISAPDPEWVASMGLPTTVITLEDLEDFSLQSETPERYSNPPLVIISDPEPLFALPQVELREDQRAAVKANAKTYSTPDRMLYAKTPEELQAVKDYLLSTPALAKFADDAAGWVARKFENIEQSRRVILGDQFIPLPTAWDVTWDPANPPSFFPEDFEPPTTVPIKIERAYVKEPDACYDKSILCARNVPGWVTEGMLRDVFGKYSTDRRPHIATRNGVEGVTITFPEIHLTPDGTGHRPARLDAWGLPSQMVTIAFSSVLDHQYDAMFALRMCRRVVLMAPNPLPDMAEVTLFFDFWIRSEFARSHGHDRAPELNASRGIRPRDSRGHGHEHPHPHGQPQPHPHPHPHGRNRGDVHRGPRDFRRGDCIPGGRGLPPPRRTVQSDPESSTNGWHEKLLITPATTRPETTKPMLPMRRGALPPMRTIHDQRVRA
jgi:hypothetical protein